MNDEIIFKDESYRLIGFGYKIFNEIGFGFDEKTYSSAYQKLLVCNNIEYKRENFCSVKINDEIVARNYFDFLIDGKIVIELKVGDKNYKKVCDQLLKYLKVSNLKLGIIIRFMSDGVKIKRIINLY